MKCYHHNDADGRCAAAIVAKAHEAWSQEQPFDPESIEFIEMDYSRVVDVDSIKPDEEVVIVDFSFKPEVMIEVMKRTRNIVWIDHHKSCAQYPYAAENINGLRDFNDKGWSGCELAWRFYFGTLKTSPIPPPLGVDLIGDYDSWRLKRVPASLDFRAGIEIEDQSPLSPMWPELFNNSEKTVEIVQNGKICIRYRDRFCQDFMKQFGFETELAGVRAYACNFYRYGSPSFGERFKAYPMCIAFAFDGTRFTVSLYSEDPDVDCAEIAKIYGGGGHRGAAGFVCSQLPFFPVGAR